MRSFIFILMILATGIVYAHSEHHHTPHAPNNASPEQKNAVEERILKMFSDAKQQRNETLYLEAIRIIQQQRTPSPRLLLYKADAQQFLHQFDQALLTLEKIDNNPGKLLMQANIYLTQGKFQRAEQICKQLFGKAEPTDVITCYSQSISMQGQLTKAHKMLEDYLSRHHLNQEHISNKSSRAWAYAVLAEMSERLKQITKAENYYIKSLKLEPQNTANRIAYLDILLKQKRFDEVIKQSRDYLQNDPVLLRYVRALNIKGDLTMNGYFCELKRRVLRYPDKDLHIHYDTQSEYEFYFTPDPAQALSSIEQHWQQQKLPRDARLFAKVAHLTGDDEALDKIRNWKNLHKLEDNELSMLIQ